MQTKLILIFIFAFVIRLIALDQSFWLDEATTANVIKNLSFSQIITTFSPTDFHPPLYYLFLKLWSSIFGYSEIALRMPSVIFSILAGYFVYLIGKKLKDTKIGLWSAVFFLFNPLIVYYSQEARMYSMVTFLLTVSFYYFIKLHPRGVRDVHLKASSVLRDFILFNLFLTLSFYTFYGSIFFILTFWIYFLINKQYRFFIFSLLFFIFSLLIIFPLLSQQFVHAKKALQIVVNWHQVLGTANLKNLLLIPLKFTSGRISFNPKIIYYLISGFWTIAIVSVVFFGGLKNKKLLFFLSFPIFLAFIFSLFSPLLQYFRFLYLIPIMSLLLAFSLFSTPPRSPFEHLGGVLVAGFIIFSLIYLLNPNFHHEDWRSLTRSLSNNQKVYMILSSSDPVKYYRSDLSLYDLTNIANKIDDKKITIIPYVADIYGLDYKHALINQGFGLESKKSFRGLELEEWTK